MVNTRSKTRKTQQEEDSDQQSGALIGSNDDLLTEILLRLPVTSILGFKSVSKHWRLLLSDSHFTQRYDNPPNSPGLFTQGTYVPFDVESPIPPPFRSLDFYPDPLGIKIVQSCNGLMLCCTHRGARGDYKYYVFNPTTKQFAVIPSVVGGYKARENISFMGLAFHQTDCVHYKIVCIRRLRRVGGLFQIQIYSSDTRKWKICNETFSIESFCMNWPFFCKGVYWNGAVHWAPSYGDHMYFNIEAEQLQMLPLPAVMTSSKTRRMYFGESRGHLHIISDPDHDDTTMDVYEMLSDCSGWFVKYQVELHELWGAFPEMTRSPYDFNIVDVVRGEKEEDTFIVVIIPSKFIRYNLHDKSFKLMCNVTDYKYRKYANVVRYIQSLASF